MSQAQSRVCHFNPKPRENRAQPIRALMSSHPHRGEWKEVKRAWERKDKILQSSEKIWIPSVLMSTQWRKATAQKDFDGVGGLWSSIQDS